MVDYTTGLEMMSIKNYKGHEIKLETDGLNDFAIIKDMRFSNLADAKRFVDGKQLRSIVQQSRYVIDNFFKIGVITEKNYLWCLKSWYGIEDAAN